MNVLQNGEILLYGTVGNLGYFWGEDDEWFTASDVVAALAEIGRDKDVTVRINSGGGVATEGVAIFNAFTAHRGKVNVSVESIAASAASIIAMAGDTVVMRTGAVMMVHDPAAFTMGDSDEHAKSIAMLETLATAYAEIYAEKTGRPVDEVRAEMKAETWMTARDAVAKGYADTVEKGKSKAEPTAFDYRIYQHAPERMVALAESRGWRHPGQTADPAAHNRQAKEIDMTDAEKAAAEAAEKTRIEAEAKAKVDAEVTARTDAAVAQERKRAADIQAACQMVGKPDKATAFIAEGKSLSEVVAGLQADRSPADVSARHDAGSGESQKDNAAAWGNVISKLPQRKAG